MGFEITFPLVHQFNEYIGIIFGRKGDPVLAIGQGIFYIQGTNGSGKSTLLSVLALLQGCIGKSSVNHDTGRIKYESHDYRGQSFDFFTAAGVREKEFCIFTQEVFFLPNLTIHQNKKILTGKANKVIKEKKEYPETLSGGWRQNSFIDMILQPDKNVWFLDEPFNNLDGINQAKFWALLKEAYEKHPKTVFLVDHRLNSEASERNENTHFRKLREIEISKTNLRSENATNHEINKITIYEIVGYNSFIEKQIKKIENTLEKE